jgi:stage II sporulation protein AA (anti-sigma F factor antagonist)
MHGNLHTKNSRKKIGYGIKKVVFNLSELTFMDSTGIGVFIGRYKKFKSKNIAVFVENPSRTVDKILQISGLYKIMPAV